MTPLPGALGGRKLVLWRLDDARHAAAWDSGEGSFRVGGRWSSRGVRAVYCAVDPATAILEVAVHKGFRTLDMVRHMLTCSTIRSPRDVHVVQPEAVPNPNWVRPGIPSAGQQAFGDGLLAQHLFVLVPSVVSAHSWNIVFDATRAIGRYNLLRQETFALDTRLHPPVP